MSEIPDGLLWIKIGKKENLESLQHEGLIYTNTIPFFHAEKNNYRGDKYENITNLFQAKEIELRANGVSLPIKNQVKIFFPDRKKICYTHIYSFMAINHEDTFIDGGQIISDNMKKFGDHLLIGDGMKFQEVVKVSLRELYKNGEILNFHMEKVKYINEKTYNGDMNNFMKTSRYSYQREGRMAIFAKNPDVPFQFKIGNLSKFTKLVSWDELKNKVTLQNGIFNLELI